MTTRLNGSREQYNLSFHGIGDTDLLPSPETFGINLPTVGDLFRLGAAKLVRGVGERFGRRRNGDEESLFVGPRVPPGYGTFYDLRGVPVLRPTDKPFVRKSSSRVESPDEDRPRWQRLLRKCREHFSAGAKGGKAPVQVLKRFGSLDRIDEGSAVVVGRRKPGRGKVGAEVPLTTKARQNDRVKRGDKGKPKARVHFEDDVEVLNGEHGRAVEQHRLRPRGRLTRELDGILRKELTPELVTDVLGGGETSPRTVGHWLRAVFGDGVKPQAWRRVVVAHKSERKKDGDDSSKEGSPSSEHGNEVPDGDIWMTVRLENQAEELLCSFRLLARLVNYMAYRPRDVGTLLLLRAKAAQYSKEIGLTPEQLSLVMHGSVALALLIPMVERRSLNSVMSGGGDLIAAWSERLRTGVFGEVDWRYGLLTGLAYAALIGFSALSTYYLLLDLGVLPQVIEYIRSAFDLVGGHVTSHRLVGVVGFAVASILFALRPRRRASLPRRT